MTTAPGSVTTTRAERGLRGGVGDSPARPDGRQKVTGEFAYSSDLWLDGMLWGATVRSPHPRARLTGLDISGALTAPGVAAVLTHEDVPGRQDVRAGVQGSAGARLGPGQVPGRAGGAGRGRPSGDGPAGGGQDRRRLRGAAAGDRRARGPGPGRPGPARGRQPGPARPDPQGSTRIPPPTWWSAASTRSACRTRRSSAPSRAWPCPPRTAASTCSWPPSGCTWTGTRSRPASACPATRCG